MLSSSSSAISSATATDAATTYLLVLLALLMLPLPLPPLLLLLCCGKTILHILFLCQRARSGARRTRVTSKRPAPGQIRLCKRGMRIQHHMVGGWSASCKSRLQREQHESYRLYHRSYWPEASKKDSAEHEARATSLDVTRWCRSSSPASNEGHPRPEASNFPIGHATAAQTD